MEPAWVTRSSCVLGPSNGEVEGPATAAGQAPPAQTLFQRRRRRTTHASRPPPTIVRRTLTVDAGVVASARGPMLLRQRLMPHLGLRIAAFLLGRPKLGDRDYRTDLHSSAEQLV